MKIKRYIGLIGFFGILAGGFPSIATAGSAASSSRERALTTPRAHRLVVVHSPLARIDGSNLSAAISRKASRLSTSNPARSIVALSGDISGTALEKAIAAIDQIPGVISVREETRMMPFVSPNDEFFDDSGQYYLQNTSDYNGATNLKTAWATGTGSSDTVIAIIDTGYTDHDDIDPSRIVAEADFVSEDEPGVFLTANDGNGRDNDAHDPGDWVTEEEAANPASFFYQCEAAPSSWHGTHVTGIAAASTNNNLGVAGVNWAAKIVQVRALGTCGGYLTDIADGIRWAAGGSVSGMVDNPHPADVINMSLGGGGDCDGYTQSAIDYAVSQGAVVVVAAGNEESNAVNVNPANCNNVITVAATDDAGEKAGFSNYGAVVDIAAPGFSILNTVNSGLTEPATNGDYSVYNYYNGTSMASPLVAGIASLMLAARPTMTPAQVEQQLKDTARDFSVSPGVSLGAGIVNAAAAIDGTYAATNVKVKVDKNNLKITFNKSSNAARYIIKRGTKTLVSNLAASATSFSDRNRATTAGNYTYKIIAVQNDGTRSREAKVTFQVKVPPKPSILVSTGIESVGVQVRFPTSTPSARSWCVYIDNRLSGCSPASTRSLIINTTRGSHSIFVRSSTLKGTSAKSNTFTVSVP